MGKLRISMFQKIASFKNLLNAYYLARKDNRYKNDVMAFDFNLEENLARIKWELENGFYSPSPYKYFIAHDSKPRNIAAPHFRDRVLQHSLVSVIEPLFEKQFVFDSYACRKNKGTHFGLKRLKKFLKALRTKFGKDGYVLKGDIKKFFPGVSWDILFDLISKNIHCPKTLGLIKKIITIHKVYGDSSRRRLAARTIFFEPLVTLEVNSVRSKEIFFERQREVLGSASNNILRGALQCRATRSQSIILRTSVRSSQPLASNHKAISIEKRQGMPIGNLTSQLFANVYLNELDHFVKEVLRERWYGRYMDDFFVIHHDKNHLKIVREKIKQFLWEKLKLTLHPYKTFIQSRKDGVCFVGYRIFYDHVLIRGSTLLRMQRKLKTRKKQYERGKMTKLKLLQTINSFKGHFKHANAFKLEKYFFKPTMF